MIRIWAQIVPFLRNRGYVMGYPFKDNAVIFWQFSTYVSVIFCGCPKIVIGSGKVGVTSPPIVQLVHKKL